MSRCDVCNDTGIVLTKSNGNHPGITVYHGDYVVVPCPNRQCAEGNRNRERRWLKLLKTTGIPRRYAGVPLSEWCKTLTPAELTGKVEIYDAVVIVYQRGYIRIDDIPPSKRVAVLNPLQDFVSLMIFGDYGVGKTALVSSLATSLLDCGKSVLYTRVQDLIGEVQDRYKPSAIDSAQAVIRLYQESPYLVLDEFELEKDSENRLEIMEQVIRYRYNHNLPTYMTGNLDPEQFTQKWGQRIATVVKDMAVWLRMGGRPLRDKAAV